MAPPRPPLLLLTTLYAILLLLLSPTAHSQRRPPPLTTTHYSKSCPKFSQIVQETTTNKQISTPTTAAAALRVFFHDCFVGGCDASVLVSSTRSSGTKSERDADVNLSLPGDGFDVVVRAKAALELACPGIVSCADILAEATRNLVVMVGGPFYTVRLGRKDSLTSRASDVEGNVPLPTMPMDQMIQIFRSKGFSVQEMVALTGAHTIGFSHCKEFSSILYNYNGTSKPDPAYYPEFAKSLQNACKDYHKDPTLSVFNDVNTPGKFDSKYFSNVRQGLGLLSSDHALSSDPRTRDYVVLYSEKQDEFFKAFASAMEKLSVYGVKMGRRGEIRHRCDAFNN